MPVALRPFPMCPTLLPGLAMVGMFPGIDYLFQVEEAQGRCNRGKHWLPPIHTAPLGFSSA